MKVHQQTAAAPTEQTRTPEREPGSQGQKTMTARSVQMQRTAQSFFDTWNDVVSAETTSAFPKRHANDGLVARVATWLGANRRDFTLPAEIEAEEIAPVVQRFKQQETAFGQVVVGRMVQHQLQRWEQSARFDDPSDINYMTQSVHQQLTEIARATDSAATAPAAAAAQTFFKLMQSVTNGRDDWHWPEYQYNDFNKELLNLPPEEQQMAKEALVLALTSETGFRTSGNPRGSTDALRAISEFLYEVSEGLPQLQERIFRADVAAFNAGQGMGSRSVYDPPYGFELNSAELLCRRFNDLPDEVKQRVAEHTAKALFSGADAPTRWHYKTRNVLIKTFDPQSQRTSTQA